MLFFKKYLLPAAPCRLLLLAATLLLTLQAGAEERAIKVKAAPIYSELARRIRAEGTVNVLITIDAKGDVTEAKALSGNNLLWPAAENAARKYKFSSASAESKTVLGILFQIEQ